MNETCPIYYELPAIFARRISMCRFDGCLDLCKAAANIRTVAPKSKLFTWKEAFILLI